MADVDPGDVAGPVFNEPWEAQAFAMTLALTRRNLISESEWSRTLAEEIVRADVAGDPDDAHTYFSHWLSALEHVVIEKGLTDEPTLARYRRAWANAAQRTPHGTPIELRTEDFSD